MQIYVIKLDSGKSIVSQNEYLFLLLSVVSTDFKKAFKYKKWGVNILNCQSVVVKFAVCNAMEIYFSAVACNDCYM